MALDLIIGATGFFLAGDAMRLARTNGWQWVVIGTGEIGAGFYFTLAALGVASS